MAGSITSSNSNLRIVGIVLAISSGFLIGVSFVVKKKGLLRSQAGGVAGEGVAYLKSWLWWCGMILMILGELCNFAAYAFVEALIVTPMGALSVVICAILSSIFLKEKLTFFGWLGCGLCIIGSTIIALNSPSHETTGQIKEFQKLFLAPGFLVWGGVLIVASLVIIFFFAPKHGTKSMMWYIGVCSMIGALSVSVTTGLGAAIVTTIKGDNQFKNWFLYFLLVFVVVTLCRLPQVPSSIEADLNLLVTEVFYLNKALALFNTAMVTPTYYVIFTTFTLITTIILFQGLDADPKEIITIVLGFFTICVGITILQMSKVDPVQLSKLDRRSTILLQAARQNTQTVDEKGAVGIEDPGIDALRGSFGTFGSIVRARSARRMSQNSRASGLQPRPTGAAAAYDPGQPWLSPGKSTSGLPTDGLKRHQLYDPPVHTPGTPSIAAATKGDDASMRSVPSTNSQIVSHTKRPTIKFDDTDLVHSYHPPGSGAPTRMDPYATHEVRPAIGSPSPGLEKQFTGGDGATSYPLEPINTASSKLPEETSLLFSGSPTSSEPYDRVPHSAPATVAYQRFRPTPERVDSRNIFDEDKRDTLLSFPSVTDSARSWDEQKTIEGSPRGRSVQRYPQSGDREESVGLIRRSEAERTPSPPSGDELEAHGGIRLVMTAGPGSGLNRF
ncbi:hypothetical protein E1B28_000177 [Marasmius oreades]|uniref:Magnesium transporter NIPA2 n=1 Tax=Marasmius oreades TaxID=181124 RepID=A0A9P7V0V0_9AGAR|nr:uncharacterized protein E1B28_000177 [Marasmius oreades]KAG7098209.1 hypothetical protein E1B28_000177 [Marasmius oreades]